MLSHLQRISSLTVRASYVAHTYIYKQKRPSSLPRIPPFRPPRALARGVLHFLEYMLPLSIAGTIARVRSIVRDSHRRYNYRIIYAFYCIIISSVINQVSSKYCDGLSITSDEKTTSYSRSIFVVHMRFIRCRV